MSRKKSARETPKPRFGGIDGSDYEFLLTFGTAESRIPLRMDSEPLVVEFGLWASHRSVKSADCRDRLM
ncbi:MAG: hypothetical protein DWI29_04420 [Planctomycetota bacterium]|nr:MAG: hypothetical protein DWI29_04420 [Planctomycetota bacterium]